MFLTVLDSDGFSCSLDLYVSLRLSSWVFSTGKTKKIQHILLNFGCNCCWICRSHKHTASASLLQLKAWQASPLLKVTTAVSGKVKYHCVLYACMHSICDMFVTHSFSTNYVYKVKWKNVVRNIYYNYPHLVIGTDFLRPQVWNLRN